MKSIRHLFFDLDHTIWDFETNSHIAFQRMFEDLQIEQLVQTSFHHFHPEYLVHNTYYWSLYAQGKINQQDLRWKRMHATLKAFDIDDETNAHRMGQYYLEILPESTQLFPYTKEILAYLQSKQYRLHILSNGFEQVQHKKLHYSGIKDFFDQIITSEACHYAKPDKKIFEYALDKAGASTLDSIMLGDSPEADLQGAHNASIKSIYVNHHGLTTDIPHTLGIKHLKELEQIF